MTSICQPRRLLRRDLRRRRNRHQRSWRYDHDLGRRLQLDRALVASRTTSGVRSRGDARPGPRPRTEECGGCRNVGPGHRRAAGYSPPVADWQVSPRSGTAFLDLRETYPALDSLDRLLNDLLPYYEHKQLNLVIVAVKVNSIGTGPALERGEHGCRSNGATMRSISIGLAMRDETRLRR